MNEPRRLKDDVKSEFERALLDAGTSYGSSEAVRGSTLAALGIAGTAALTAGTAGGASSALLTKAGWTKLLAISGIGVTAAAPVGYYAWQHVGREPAPVVAAQPQEARPLPPAPRTPEPPAPEPLVEPPVRATPVAPRVEPKSSSASALAAELGALDAARSRLAAGDAQGALSLLDDHARIYPRGRLVLEAEVLRIDALAKSGQMSAAKRRAEAFLKRHPNSVLASRVRTYLTD
jgi:hypothetical protein